MDEIKQALDLPWPILLTLASGYAAYFVANYGLRDHHKSIDVAFSSLVFGLFAASCYHWLLSQNLWADWVRSAVTFLAAVVLGALWNLFGRPSLEWLIWHSGISHSDELPSGLAAIFSKKGVTATQLSVRLIDGSWLMSDRLKKFDGYPNGPCSISKDGDILMYVTDTKVDDKSDYVPLSPDDPTWGAEITYIPANQVQRIYLRRKST